MKALLDGQLPPALGPWLEAAFPVEATPAPARDAGVVVMPKDADFASPETTREELGRGAARADPAPSPPRARPA